MLDPGSASRSGRALVLVQVAAGRAELDPESTVRVGDGPSSFLGWKHWKKPDNAFNYSRPAPTWEPRNPTFRAFPPKVLATKAQQCRCIRMAVPPGPPAA